MKRWMFFGVLLLGGCAASHVPAPTPSETGAATFVRNVTPFPVLDAAGEPYVHPFLGGFNVPRPQFVDIDGDGDPDLFLQEESNQLMFFENTGTPQAPAFTWRTDRFGGVEVGDWFRFADLDQDGDPDLLSESPFSHIRYWRNEGTRQQPRFVLGADTLRDASGQPIFSDRQNIPNLTDLDCDQLPDLFIGKLDGTVARYEATGEGNGVPRFRLLTERFENIEVVAQIAQPGSWHGANTLVFHDYDRDGDLDLFWGDFFEPGLLLIENRGTCRAPSFSDEYQPFPLNDPVTTSGYNASTFADIDGDGDDDLFLGVIGGAFNPNRTARANFYFLENIGTGHELRTRRFLHQIDVGSESVPAWADYDGDGDLDLFLANKIADDGTDTARLYLFRNDGTPQAPALALTDSLALIPAYHYAPAFGDLDGDGQPDLLAGTWNNGVFYYRNENGRFTGTGEPLFDIPRGSHTTPTLGDLDGDGDLDALVGETSGTLNFFRNEGSLQQPLFVLVTEDFEGIDVGRRSTPFLADFDGDGDLDLLIGSEGNGLYYYRNDGSPQQPHFVRDETAFSKINAPRNTAPVLADVDGDGDLDLFMGTYGGGVLYFERQ